MEFITARPEHLEDMWRITLDAKAQLKGLGLDQWQKGYPSLEVWQQDFVDETGLLAVEDGQVLAACAYLTTHDPSYTTIDGAWLTGDIRAYGSLHRVCVADQAKGKGVAGKLFAHAFAITKAAGLPSVRIDTHPGNLPMQKTLAKNGFMRCGIVILPGDPAVRGSRERVAFEKDW